MRRLLLVCSLIGVPAINLFAQITLDLSRQAVNLEIMTTAAQHNLGMALACGDLNGDGFADLVIGAPQYQPDGAPVSGKVFIIFGREQLPATLELENPTLPVTTITAAAGQDIGAALLVADLNGDTIADLCISAPSANVGSRPRAGLVYNVYGHFGIWQKSLDLSIEGRAKVICGATADAETGFALGSGDFNGDQIAELTIGAPYAQKITAPNENTGGVYIIWQHNDFPDSVDLALPNVPVTFINGRAESDYTGYVVAGGDVNGDGFADLIIGAHKANVKIRDEGMVYVLYGKTNFSLAVDLATQDADVTFSGDQYAEHLGFFVTGSDYDRDGKCDLLLSARQANFTDLRRVGTVCFYPGRSDFPTQIDVAQTAPELLLAGELENQQFGYRTTVSDLNGDNLPDFILAAPSPEISDTLRTGIVYVLFGRSTLPDTISLQAEQADLKILGSSGQGELGAALTTGDCNGDGFADLFISEPKAKPNGMVYAILGGPTTRIQNHFDQVVPVDFALLPVYPNPFYVDRQQRLSIPLRLPSNQRCEVHCQIFDLLGRLVWEKRMMTAGGRQELINWDGRSTAGSELPTGLYYLRVTAGGEAKCQKVLLLRESGQSSLGSH